MRNVLRKTSFAVWTLVLGTSVGANLVNAQTAAAAGPDRATRSAESPLTERPDRELREDSLLRDALESPRRKPRATGKGEMAALQSLAPEAWIYDASVELFHDADGDGYLRYLRVRFDADSVYYDHFLYARLYLSDGEWWQEYHVTRDFVVDGSSPFDDFEVETELAAGFPTGLYDLLIELYDADTGAFLDELGPADTSAFALLPLEDLDHDLPPPVVVVTHEHGGGGSTGLAGLVGLVLLGFAAHLRRSCRLAVAAACTGSKAGAGHLRLQHWRSNQT